MRREKFCSLLSCWFVKMRHKISKDDNSRRSQPKERKTKHLSPEEKVSIRLAHLVIKGSLQRSCVSFCEWNCTKRSVKSVSNPTKCPKTRVEDENTEGLTQLRSGILIWILLLHPLPSEDGCRDQPSMWEVSQGPCCKGVNEKLIVWLLFRRVMSELLTRLKNFYSSL